MKGGRWMLWLAAAIAMPCHAAGEAAYARAMERYEAGDYGQAYAHFGAAADAGHLRAREIAGLMALIGPALYPAVPLDRREGLRRLRQAAEAGSELGRHVACAEAQREGEDSRAPCIIGQRAEGRAP